MTVVKDFEAIGTRGFFRPVAECTFEQAVAMTVGAIRTARELRLTEMIVNTNGFTGFAREAFTNELDALKWLDARQPTRTPDSVDRTHPEE